MYYLKIFQSVDFYHLQKIILSLNSLKKKASYYNKTFKFILYFHIINVLTFLSSHPFLNTINHQLITHIIHHFFRFSLNLNEIPNILFFQQYFFFHFPKNVI